MITRFLLSAAVIGGLISMSHPALMNSPERIGNPQKPRIAPDFLLAQYGPMPWGPPYPMGPTQRHYYPGPPYFSGPYPRFDDGSGERYFRVPNYDPRIDPRMFRPPPNLPPPWMRPY